MYTGAPAAPQRSSPPFDPSGSGPPTAKIVAGLVVVILGILACAGIGRMKDGLDKKIDEKIAQEKEQREVEKAAAGPVLPKGIMMSKPNIKGVSKSGVEVSCMPYNKTSSPISVVVEAKVKEQVQNRPVTLAPNGFTKVKFNFISRSGSMVFASCRFVP